MTINFPIIVVSSPKPKIGNSVLSLNLAGALWNDNYTVGLFSSHQNQITSFLKSRAEFAKKNKTDLIIPKQISSLNGSSDISALVADISATDYNCHKDIFSIAHTLITPLNYKDDILWKSNDKYLNFIWEIKKVQASHGIKYLNWIIVPYLKNNDIDFSAELEEQAKRFGFKVAPAIYYRDEYMHITDGYCAADLQNKKLEKMMSLNDLYARREILQLAEFIWQKK